MPLVSLPARTSKQGIILLLSMTASQKVPGSRRAVHMRSVSGACRIALNLRALPLALFARSFVITRTLIFHNFIKHCPSTRKNSLIFVDQAGRFFPGETAWQPDYLPPEPSKMLCRNRLCLKRLTHRTAPDNRNARNKIRQPARYL